MEGVVRFYDAIDDFVMSTWFSLRRSLAWKPRERRRVPRTSDKAPTKHAVSGEEKGDN